MDLLEWVFYKISDKKTQAKRSQENLYAVRTENEIIVLKTLVSFILQGESPPLFAGKGLGRASGETIILPEQISFFKEKSLNRQVLIHKTLAAGVIYKNKIKYSKKNPTYAERSLEIYHHREKIKEELSEIFPQYQEFHLNLEKNLADIKASKFNEETDYHKLVKHQKPDLFSRWQRFPEHSLALWVEPLENTNLNASSEELNRVPEEELSDDQRLKKAHQGTEMEGSSSTEAVEEVSLEKKKKEQSPVFHSFEKLEAADEYNGGSRVSDSTDELEDHKEALAELNLKHVIREGGGAGSIYKGHFSELFGSQLIKKPKARYGFYKKTPEWNYKKNEFLADHCRLYLLEGSQSEEDSRKPVETDFKMELQSAHASEIELWKLKINSLVNLRKWKDRQLEGPEWSLDAYTRYCADIKASGQGDHKIFIQNFKQQRDYHVSILMDLSLSTESWVQNKKVLDVQLESIGLCGLLLEDLDEPVSISTTWSETRHHCYVQKIKDYNSSWDNYFQVAKDLIPRGYTRLGPSIRHAISELQNTGSKKKLLILLTDGKPTDLDHYEGRYGIEDMRHAMIEAEQAGVYVQALAIDSEAKFYFPQIFSKNNYQILSDPKYLPEQLFKIYFNFTRHV